MKDDMVGQPLEKRPGSDICVKSAIILAGGLGTRLRGVVQDLPKAMAPIKGRPFLEYLLDYWIRQGIRHFILSVGYRREIIMNHFGEKYRDARIEYAVEESSLGTGGGLLLAIKKLDKRDPFLLLNGDTFFEVVLSELVKFHCTHQSDWTFSLFRTEEKNRFMGMEIDAGGRVLSLRSASGQSGQFANGGVYLVNPRLLSFSDWKPGAKLSLEDEILPVLFAGGMRVFGYACKGRFIDIGLPGDYSRSASILAA
jgi:D-glycero-alpha-D-manno-heptose 1-phosphate guanylyltransferase